MKLIHAADLHARAVSINEFMTSLSHIADAAKDLDADLVALSGDIWDGPTQNSAGALFPEFIEAIRSLADICPVAMIYGTPSHDVEGSLEVFENVKVRHQIRILRPGQPYLLAGSNIKEAIKDEEYDSACLLFGFPEPSPKWLLAKEEIAGGRGAEAKARDVLSTLCLATGAMRDRYPHIPCLVLAHGKVEGATLRGSMKVEKERGLAFTRDDLKNMKAEYIAFGDLHEPQHVEGTRAWYAGSIYPTDYGENHRAGCWAVTMNSPREAVDVERISFSHPVRRHLISSGECAYEVPGMHGEQVWYEIRCSREQAARIDTDIVLARLNAHGAAKGSKVTLTIKPQETARLSEIRDVRGFLPKLELWAQGTRLVLSESLKEKARQLERETLIQHPVASESRFIVERLILRGAIGVWKKSRKQEIDLDLASKGPGVIAFTGRNGMGKTTIVENLHPWPRLLTRDGVLRSHFMLSDSFRDLRILDSTTGHRYRFLIKMRADIPSGSNEYWIFRDDGNGFEPLPEINGRLEPYEDCVQRLFGSLDLYLRTAFIAQKAPRGVPDLADATKGERKVLFGELAGIRWLEAYRNSAKDRYANCIHEFEIMEAMSKKYQNLGTMKEDAVTRISTCQASLKELAARLRKVGKLLAASEEQEERRTKLRQEKYDLVREREVAFNAIMSAKGRERETSDELEKLRISLRSRENAGKQKQLYDELSERISTMQRQASAIEAVNRRLDREHSTRLNEYLKSRDDLLNERDQARKDAGKLEAKIESLKNSLKTGLETLCPTCGQMIPEDKKIKLRLEQERIQASLAEQEKILEKLKSRIVSLSMHLDEHKRPESPAKLEFEHEAELSKAQEEQKSLDLNRILDILARAETAEERIEKGRRLLSQLERDIAKASKVQESCNDKIKLIDQELERIGTEHDRKELENQESELIAQEAREQERLETAQRALAAVDDLEKERDASMQAMMAFKDDALEWDTIHRAAGPDGIQALELDALAPGISETATRLLAASGYHGTIEIHTTRTGGKGSKERQIEDFLIIYIDQDGNEQEISTLSGGESVWIRKAVYDAFEVVRSRSTGLQVMTVVMDEADGALDAESKMRYLRMIQAAHRESGRFQTILITHSQELQSMVDTCLKIEDLKPSESSTSHEIPEEALYA